MAKAAIVVLADTETHADLGRIANALTSANEFKEAGDETTIVFDGAGKKIKKTDVPLLEEYAGHPSLQRLVSQGYQVITF